MLKDILLFFAGIGIVVFGNFIFFYCFQSEWFIEIFKDATSDYKLIFMGMVFLSFAIISRR